jgi:Leucine-rich repeat (LRR) protein
MQTKYQSINPAQAPDTSAFVDIKNNHTLLRYFQNLQQYFMYANNFGLALDDEDRPDSAQPQAYLRNLFVPPHLSEKHFQPEQIIALEKQNQNQNWLDVAQVLKEHPRLFILGDPGAGKSTLLSWLMLSLSYSGDNLTKMMIGERVPFLLVLRDLSLSQVKDWNSLWHIFLNNDNNKLAEPLRKDPDIIDTLFEKGQALLLIDGLDEVTQPEARQQLGQAVLEGINHYPRCGFVITSRLLGFDQDQWFGLETARLFQSVAAALSDIDVDKKTYKGQSTRRHQQSTHKWIESSKKLNNQQRYLWNTFWHYQLNAELPPLEILQENIGKERSNLNDIWKYWSKFSSAVKSSELPVFYLAPFNNAQTQQFIENWYRQYLGRDNTLSQRITNLQQCIIDHDGLGHLARIPVLLNMICFIHSRRGRLPDGRAELYQRISETYLTSLDRARGIKFRDQEFNYDYLDLCEWLGKLALKLQDDRNEKDQSLLISQTLVKELLNEELINRGMSEQQADKEVEFILAYIAQRSGLFIPRGQNSNHEDQYGFAHLSFLEYFAAFALKQEAQIDTACLTDRQPTINFPWWHECWALFFEQLEHSRLTEKYLTELFKNSFETQDWSSVKHVLLLAKIVMDSSVRLGIQVRHNKIKDLCIYYLENNWVKVFSEGGKEINALCELMWSERFDSRHILVKQAKDSSTIKFALTGSAINDLSPLSGLNQLRLLLLPATAIRDLTPLAGLKELGFLDIGNTAISDLSPLVQLSNLSVLILSSTAINDLSPLAELNQLTFLMLTNTAIKDLSPLAGLNQLSGLYLRNTAIDDLLPLAGLTQLTELYLSSTAINNLSPLSRLSQLIKLDLGNTSIIDLSPLAGLSQLIRLDLRRTAISDLSALAGLGQLSELDLSNTAISDLSPLAGLSQLRKLDLSYTTIGDLSPLAGLSQLVDLDLRRTNISDLSPLAGLSQLRELNLSNTAIGDLIPLAELNQLGELDLSNTAIGDLAPLAGLSQLIDLDLGNTSIIDLSPLAGLSQLIRLDLRRTAISDITPLAKLNNLKLLHLPSKNIKGTNSFTSKNINLTFDN